MIKLTDLLLEKQGDSYDSGAVMLNLNIPKDKIHSKIDKNDLYIEEGDRTYGLEDEPHVTLLYGLESDKIDDNDLKKAFNWTQFPKLYLYNVSLFKNDNYDVLKFDIFDKTKSLYKANNILTKNFPYKTDYPDYHPHCTIAYIKPGLGNKYVKIFKNLKIKVQPGNVIYSKPDGTKINL